ncbi:MAG: hypothetical protein ACD_71C00104G0009 [uncultured bacterium (gcode 4)]|uniref:Resolvase/invertase-type recombinase catalytic domain-containing protein n=1 Tax=uncultured bacterium (gcode 4) TaxID=1234023 RepID=K1Z4V3_9BACT|nr:MAG: hypothetical protein ACD_71C00104G0009 [uncultured bacterium (gcode 4)]
MKKIVAYIRVSTGPEEKQIRIEEQEDAILKYIQQYNKTSGSMEHLELIQIFREYGSAKNPWRTVFNQMINSIKKWHYDKLLSLNESLLSRNPIDTQSLNELLCNWYIEGILMVSSEIYYDKIDRIPQRT